MIDGYSQPFSHNNNLSGIGSDADLRIVLDGTGAGSSNGLSLTGGSSVIRGLVIQNFGNLGIAITGGSAHRIEGNFIGTDVAGTLDRGNAGNGISINPAVGGVQIGGAPAFRNLISGNNGAGISPSGSPANIQNNLIGTTRDGSSPLGISFAGITTGASGITIDSNRIRSNGSVGVLVFGTGQVEILGNGIANNTSRGIDLNNDGVTLNDANDVDSGPNGLQNFPVLSKVEQGSGGVLRVEGSLDRPAGAAAFSYVLEFFSNSACDGSHGEGETPLFSSTVNFASGSAETFAVNGTGLALAAGTVVTATATDANGNTSEFSACFNSTLQPDSIFANRFE